MVNYIVCLAHFCELHGPTIIICTQVVSKSFLQDNLLSSNSRLASCASCQLNLPNSSVNITSSIKLNTSNSNTDNNHNDAGEVAGDQDQDQDQDQEQICISTHYPALSKRYSALTKLVMKSLSVETTSELSKPMFYGDAINGYCVNQIFKIEDVNARGGERKYSLMIISDDEFELLNNWDILLIYLNEIIELTQKKVEEKNAKIEALNNLLNMNMNGDGSGSGSGSGNGNGNGNGGGGKNGNVLDNERFLRRSLIKPKSLTELTNDDEIFVKFHLLATELLKDIYK